MTVERLGIGEDRLDTVFRKMTMLDDFDHADLVSLAKRGTVSGRVDPLSDTWPCAITRVRIILSTIGAGSGKRLPACHRMSEAPRNVCRDARGQ